MTLQQRIDLMVRLGNYMISDDELWQNAKQKASAFNPWFIPEFIDHSARNIAQCFLQPNLLVAWAQHYHIPDSPAAPKRVGVVMAGNIPLVGFHDLLCVFIAGHRQSIKLSSKDEVLLPHLLEVLRDWAPEVADYISIADKLNGCEAYIATGSNNSGRYFEYYFAKYPHIIRRNRTSVAVLSGNESAFELAQLADDIQMYFGLGCRNVTKLYVPAGYHFEPLLRTLEKYQHFVDFHKYKNNYDYQLALLMMGNKMYMTNGSVLISQNASLFSAVSHVHYEEYTDTQTTFSQLKNNPDVQAIVAAEHTPFGAAQQPGLFDYADGVDTMQFLIAL